MNQSLHWTVPDKLIIYGCDLFRFAEITSDYIMLSSIEMFQSDS